ncbi:unnamed protein product [Agarophyton chilense]|eukprot:gb/GEZJ01003216.1/.p1 GENE.gb/GEZJ01003216.1/~~gb/GEZJ01003216.1/.p1  ORF type:complete len:524 (+),score=70.24 gb/GEZJ01003216.1/:1695-3266(+)
MSSFLRFLVAMMCVGVVYAAVVPKFSLRPLVLPTVARLFDANTLLGVTMHKASADLTSTQCAGATILHEAVGFCNNSSGGLDDVSIIPHSAIVHDGMRCGTGHPLEYMFIIPASKLTDETTADSNGVLNVFQILSANPRALNAFNVLNDIDPVHVGVEANRPRICGEKVMFTVGTIFIFLRTRTGASDLNFGFAYLAATELGMVSVKTDEQLCLYKETRKLAPGQDPLPTPTPSPTNVPKLPADSFVLQNAPNMRQCFPLERANSTVPISMTPSIAPSSTPSPSPSPSATVQLVVDTTTISPTPSASMSTSPRATSSPTPSPSLGSEMEGDATPAPDDSEDDFCFPESARVELESGEVIPISNVNVGDRVRVDGGAYSEVYFFTHRVRNVIATFLRLSVSSGAVLTLTPTHYVPVGGRLKAARDIRIGDVLVLGNGTLDTVTRIAMTKEKGLFNPHTMGGTIVVDGIVASAFTESVLPSTGEALLSPLRLLYKSRLFDSFFKTIFAEGNTFLANMVPRGGPLF